MENNDNKSENGNLMPTRGVKPPLPVRVFKVPPKDSERQFAYDRLDSEIDLIVELIANGAKMTKICEYLDCAVSTFYEWKKVTEFSLRIEAAMEASAENYIERGLEVLERGQADGNMAEAQLKRSLADKLFWLAEKRNRNQYGKNTENNINVNVNQNTNSSEFAQIIEIARERKRLSQQGDNANENVEDAEVLKD